MKPFTVLARVMFSLATAFRRLLGGQILRQKVVSDYDPTSYVLVLRSPNG